MSKFIAYVKQKGHGCDYTIACGYKLIELESNSINEAEKEMVEIIDESFNHDMYKLKSCEIFEVSNSKSLSMNNVYKKLKFKKLDKLNYPTQSEVKQYIELVGATIAESWKELMDKRNDKVEGLSWEDVRTITKMRYKEE